MRVTIPEDMKYFCVIETIALYIQSMFSTANVRCSFGNTGKIDSLIPTMTKHKTERYLVPAEFCTYGRLCDQVVGWMLQAYKECVMYRTVSNGLTEEEVKNFDYDMLVFFSPTGVKALKGEYP